VSRSLFLIPALLALGASAAQAAGPKEIQWTKDVRAALTEAEDRGVPLLVYLTRDD
jgi:hypothetical protein